MKTFARVLIGIVVIAAVGLALIMISINQLHSRTRREAIRMVSEIPAGTPFTQVVARLGQPSQCFTNPADIRFIFTNSPDFRLMNTPAGGEFLTNTILHRFQPKGIPIHWIHVYSDPATQTVVHASWEFP